ncbi:MAG: hypothetical protein DRN99_09695 [Thermoproteota archaeon]|nr:MAG: hypothetical protein DRN99_09695 [Candidatus Korarchaeota archaeon]
MLVCWMLDVLLGSWLLCGLGCVDVCWQSGCRWHLVGCLWMLLVGVCWWPVFTGRYSCFIDFDWSKSSTLASVLKPFFMRVGVGCCWVLLRRY